MNDRTFLRVTRLFHLFFWTMCGVLAGIGFDLVRSSAEPIWAGFLIAAICWFLGVPITFGLVQETWAEMRKLEPGDWRS